MVDKNVTRGEFFQPVVINGWSFRDTLYPRKNSWCAVVVLRQISVSKRYCNTTDTKYQKLSKETC